MEPIRTEHKHETDLCGEASLRLEVRVHTGPDESRPRKEVVRLVVGEGVMVGWDGATAAGHAEEKGATEEADEVVLLRRVLQYPALKHQTESMNDKGKRARTVAPRPCPV